MPQSGSRPERLALKDFDGRIFTLAAEEESWQYLGGAGPDLLLLGLGPEQPWRLPFVAQKLAQGHKVYWLENAQTLEQTALNFSEIPEIYAKQWQKLENLPAPSCQIYFYKPGIRLEPEFWGKILAEIDLDKSINNTRSETGSAVWLPGDEKQLLHQEIYTALKEENFKQIFTGSPAPDARSLLKSWRDILPALAISVNFRGLDAQGHIFYLLQTLGVPLAIWLVDNPWHLVSAFRLPWWREANIFLTDASFIPALKAQGVKNIFHLPLAAAPHMWRQSRVSNFEPPLFIGRSAFPDKENFFKGAKVDRAKWSEALKMLEDANSPKPDYHWWSRDIKLWPGGKGRACGLGADDCSALNRGRWLNAALKSGLRIVGDDGWHSHLPGVPIEKPIDYYGKLPDYYQNAQCVLNITSLLLPQSLSQRHFDVWASGGLLLSDATKGLDIFPEDLIAPIRLQKPEDFNERLNFFNERQQKRLELIQAWQGEIAAKHLYNNRIRSILECIL